MAVATKEKNDTHKIALRGESAVLIKGRKLKTSTTGSSKLVAEFFEYSINTILFQRGVYPAEDFTPVKKYGLNMLVSSDDQVKSYIKRIMSQLNKWMQKSKISRFVVVITSKETGEHVERWQFDVNLLGRNSKSKTRSGGAENENADSKSVDVGSLLLDIRSLTSTVPLPKPTLRRQKVRFKKKYRPYSDKSQLQSPSYLCLMAIALSMCLFMLMQTLKFPWNGATVTRKRSRMEKRSN